MKKSQLIFNVALVPLDFLMLTLAGLSTYILRTRILDFFRPVLFEFNLPLQRFMILVFFVSFVFVAAYALTGLYAIRRRSIVEDFSKILIGSSAGLMGMILFIFLRQELFDSRFLLIGGWLLANFFVFGGRVIFRKVQKYLVARYNVGVQRVMIIGDDNISNQIGDEIRNNLSSGYRIVKQLANPEVDQVRSAIGNPGIDEVILANPNYPASKVREIVEFCHENHLVFKLVPNIHQTLTKNYAFDTFIGVPLFELQRTALDGWGKVTKRSIDIIGSLFGLIILSPIYLITAFLIKLESAGTVFVKLKRISQNKEFNLFKFRSMIKGAEKLKPLLENLNERHGGPLFKMRNDPRITKIGKFIRKTRIDELPQFLNVLKGDLSLVGPRPHEPKEISEYKKHHKKVLGIKAGATGMAQVSGSSDLPFEQEVNLDTYYIENWSLFLDFKIILKTVFKMILDRSAV